MHAYAHNLNMSVAQITFSAVNMRATLMAKKDLAKELSNYAKKQGKPLYSLTNEIIEQFLKITNQKSTFQDALEQYEQMQLIKKTGGVIISKHILYYCLSDAYNTNRRALLEKWYRVGECISKYFASISKDPFELLQKYLNNSTSDATFEIANKDGKTSFTCVCPNTPIAYQEAISQFIEGFMHELRYKTENKEIHKDGLISLIFGSSQDQSR